MPVWLYMPKYCLEPPSHHLILIRQMTSLHPLFNNLQSIIVPVNKLVSYACHQFLLLLFLWRAGVLSDLIHCWEHKWELNNLWSLALSNLCRFSVPLYPELICSRLRNEYYRSLESVKHDIMVMMSNAELYFSNPELGKMRRLSDWFTRKLSRL